MVQARVEICGGIASGKTTLATLLQRRGMIAVFEDFAGNPFWKLFCTNPANHAFEAEITFLLQHYCEFRNQRGRLPLICDSSITLDLAYADLNLKGTAKEAFLGVYREVSRMLPRAALLIHLRCSPEEELRRICARGRTEERGVSLEYLRALNNALAARVDEVGANGPVLEIDSEENDFAHDQKTSKRIADLVLSGI